MSKGSNETRPCISCKHEDTASNQEPCWACSHSQNQEFIGPEWEPKDAVCRCTEYRGLLGRIRDTIAGIYGPEEPMVQDIDKALVPGRVEDCK